MDRPEDIAQDARFLDEEHNEDEEELPRAIAQSASLIARGLLVAANIVAEPLWKLVEKP